MTALYFGSASSGSPGGFTIPDWITHGAAYLVLGLLMARALAGSRSGTVTPGVAILAALLSTAYGVTDEFHQSFVPGRDASTADVAKDLGGSVIGALLYRRFATRQAGSHRGAERSTGEASRIMKDSEG
jgi:VanZ family protein